MTEAPPGPGDGLHREYVLGDVCLHAVERGAGEPVLLLHGFPEFWYSWRRQLPALADAGFRAVAPDLRGYNESSRPVGVANYRAAKLVADAAGLVRALGAGPAFVVGHDWGGVLAWRLAALHPELVRKLAILNAPHPARYRQELWRNPAQWLRSWYVFFFQTPWLPERALRAGNFSILERALRRHPVHPAAFTAADVDEYRRAFAGPGALTGPLNYYRAAVRYPQDLYGPPQQVAAPTLLVWGEHDPYLGPRLTHGLERWVPRLRVERIPDASHWVQNDAPDRVNRLLIDFFREPDR